MELKLLSQKEVSERAGMHRHTIAAWVEKGQFPMPHVVSGRRKYWTRLQIDAFLRGKPDGKKK